MARPLDCHPRACREDPSCRKVEGIGLVQDFAVHTYWTYILASRPYGTLYIGVTNNLLGRIEAHRQGSGSKFTARYGVKTLVHFEPFGDIEVAIQREKTLKHWVRQWKINLIERENPHWMDLYPSLLALPGNGNVPARGDMGPRDKREDDNG